VLLGLAAILALVTFRQDTRCTLLSRSAESASSSILKSKASFLEGDPAVTPDNQVVYEVYAEKLAGRYSFLGEAYVFIIYMEKVAILEVRYVNLTGWQCI
jgi:hypothetical protein